MPGATSSFLLVVAMPFATSSFLLLPPFNENNYIIKPHVKPSHAKLLSTEVVAHAAPSRHQRLKYTKLVSVCAFVHSVYVHSGRNPVLVSSQAQLQSSFAPVPSAKDCTVKVGSSLINS